MQVAVFPTVASLPDLAPFEGYQPVAIDVLRATTTIVTALANGANAVIPTLTPEEARAAAPAHNGALLGGERKNVRLPGFDFGNSPREYGPSLVAGRPILFTTSNGTRAIHAVAPLGPVLIAALVNVGAVVRRLRQSGAPVLILCAGTNDELSLEDTVCAGAIADGLGAEVVLNDFGMLARELFQKYRDDLPGLMRIARHGLKLESEGFGPDLDLCAAVDQFDLAPAYLTGQIR